MGGLERAKELLAAAKRKQCGHGSSYTCAVCEARIHAEVYFEGLDVKVLLASYIGAVEALEEVQGALGPEHSLLLESDFCLGCQAGLGFEKLFPEEVPNGRPN
jgi:hypothetical protein